MGVAASERRPMRPQHTSVNADDQRPRPEAGARVLVVDDETPIVEAVAYSLRKEGFQTATACDAEQCLDLVGTYRPDLIILDVMLPSASGFDVCRALRKQGDVPIVMLTARADETDRVVGLELGADDYIVKPFSMRELIARVKSVLRRASSAAEAPAERPIQDRDLMIDPARFEVRRGDDRIDLSPKEFDLLRFLISHPGQVFSRQQLLDRVWGADAYVEERTVDVHIRWLREKIEAAPSRPERILTVRGVGYKYRGG
jgi:phosphate regulon transcriptional regulator PhoB